ncbi:hypothetical protein STRTUCAR8_03281 [Streptomyces turgidiscabies Car8]|uniref:Uncharacterized protein n=1 Tax=Streptomyces turgidiscabies (strain Car8) TaxID=698760 RepID=L7FBP8_STRT8|nr:hypothetical protein STRTUCAR8_03281 [Streptomyces turgidiscabies Car8]
MVAVRLRRRRLRCDSVRTGRLRPSHDSGPEARIRVDSHRGNSFNGRGARAPEGTRLAQARACALSVRSTARFKIGHVAGAL